MTTYLSTNHRGKRNEVTYAYCSKMCRYRHTSGSPRIPRKNMEWRDDTSYEFNETCLNCGALIPADWSKGGGIPMNEIDREARQLIESEEGQ